MIDDKNFYQFLFEFFEENMVEIIRITGWSKEEYGRFLTGLANIIYAFKG